MLQGVHSPLQGRSSILDLDFARANQMPADYESDLDSIWSNPSN